MQKRVTCNFKTVTMEIETGNYVNCTEMELRF